MAATQRTAQALGVARHDGRGLCATCRSRARRAGALDGFGRRTFARDELLEEWAVLRGQGFGRSEAAARLGMSFAALDRALYRARAAGDVRAVAGRP